ncbi:HAAS domain-containing protein [Peribacillus frigoritolerans]|uniref:HAAS domain-containing protein n=1 Tax=Peribacillus frigoritolerans TaxID=450367 RepID=UPI0032E3969D
MLDVNKALSRESQLFLEDLRLYLFSSGKKTAEIEDLIEELEVHLFEAERNEKSVEHIIGRSPKEYMKLLSDEMSVDFKGWLKYIAMILIGAFSYWIIAKAINGGIEFSLLEIIGYPLAAILSIFGYMLSFRYMASHKLSKVKQGALLYGLGIISIALFACLILFSEIYSTTFIEFENTGNIIAVILAISIFILISLWSKSWVSIIIPILLFAPEVLLKQTHYQGDVNLILSSLITMLGILLYCGYTIRKTKSS